MTAQDLSTIRGALLGEIAGASDLAGLERARVAALGKKGRLTELMKGLGQVAAEERKSRGAELNALKGEIEAALNAQKAKLEDADLDARLRTERVDITLPARPEAEGRLHPISQTIDEIVAIFGAMGFKVAEGPDIEDDFHNFTALNIPEDHPARQMMDTFYLPERPDGSRLVLRTHTSPVQIRTMMSQKPPIRIIVPGRTYRCDSDMTHTPMFHQVEGLVIDKTSHMGHLKGCLADFCRAFFEVPDVPIRFRPSFFPFVEPGAEMDIGCSRKGGELKIGAGDDWLEILGCGMVHPKVLQYCNLNPAEYQGFAFGMGIERVAMLKYGIPDLRTFYEADLRWLRHYGFPALEVATLVRGLVPQ
ncbi:MAG: phenylalanine--tRNA ligase subunit alpha [Alphaproteobacteria bacterium]|nr:phenylalanine--tRNA ligase subunit alpha [Alphaproteobacteria bacterium]